MIVHGKTRDFKLTIGASLAIAEICPDGDMERLGEVLTGPYHKVMKNAVSVILALQKGYEDARAIDEPGYVPDYMTAEEIMALAPDEFKALEQAAISAFKADLSATVDTEFKKK